MYELRIVSITITEVWGTDHSSVQRSMVGADLARPSSKLRLSRSRCRSINPRSTCLVNRSDGFSAPKTFDKEKSLVRSLSCTQRSATAKCRTLPRPRLRHMPMAAEASECRPSDHVKPRSLAMDSIPKPSEPPLQIPVSSASAVLRVTVL